MFPVKTFMEGVSSVSTLKKIRGKAVTFSFNFKCPLMFDYSIMHV